MNHLTADQTRGLIGMIICILFSISFCYVHYREKRKPKVIPYTFDDNLYNQYIYLEKIIKTANSDYELGSIHKQIREFEKWYMEDPDIGHLIDLLMTQVDRRGREIGVWASA